MAFNDPVNARPQSGVPGTLSSEFSGRGKMPDLPSQTNPNGAASPSGSTAFAAGYVPAQMMHVPSLASEKREVERAKFIKEQRRRGLR